MLKRIFLTVAVLAWSVMPASAKTIKTLSLDVCMDGASLVVDSDGAGGMPDRGDTFIVTGKIYPGGTLTATGACPGGSIGTWTCRGWFTGTGLEVFSTQDFFLSDDTTSLATEGIEHDGLGLAHLDTRVITGGTGKYDGQRGQHTEERLGVKSIGDGGGFNIHFTFTLLKTSPEAKK
jgi:hypothetical protein